MKCYKCATPIPDDSRFCSTCGADVSGAGATVAVAPEDTQLQSRLQAELGTEYILERELGRGGMAVVYLGRDAHLNRKVAVKLLPPELTYGGGTMIERFKREAQTAAKLDHPNIIPVYRVAPGGTLLWYVMKFLEGESLDHVLAREGQLTVERTVDIVGQTAAALQYAHDNQVVHRDVKPANVVVDGKGRVTVTDFGIAKALDASTLTASGSVIGTPYYMSPEQCKGKKVGPPADQYSLAVMTYQMLGGHVPFDGESAVEIVHKHVADPPPPLAILRPQLPERLLQVVDRGLAKAAEERFASVAEFARALKAAAEGVDITVAPPQKVPVRTSKTALVSPVPGAMQPVATVAPTAAAAAAPAPRRWGMLVGGLAGGLVVAAIAVAAVLKPWARPVAPPVAQGGGVVLRDTTKPAVDTARPAADTSRPAADTTTPSPPSGRNAATGRVVLRGVPASATIERDGRRARGPAIVLEAGRKHTITVAAAGFEMWSRDVTLRAGQRQTLEVSLTPTAKPLPPAGGGDRAGGQGATGGGAALGVAYVTGYTDPPSMVYVNGARVKRTPLVHVQVPAGQVELRFEVSDASGVWSVTRTMTLQSGQDFRITPMPLRLTKPPK